MLRATEPERREYERAYPQAIEAFTMAESAALAERLPEAAQRFSELLKTASQSGLVYRRYCEVLTDLGRKQEALEACEKGIYFGQDASFLRSKVRAHMSGPNPPSQADFVAAYQMASGIRKRLAHRTEGHAGMFDIAWRLGDRTMMNGFLADLEQVAPSHHETLRARILAATSPFDLWKVRLGWFLVVGLSITSLLRALKRFHKAKAVF